MSRVSSRKSSVPPASSLAWRSWRRRSRSWRVESNSRCSPPANSSASGVSTSSMRPLAGAWISRPFTSTLAIPAPSLNRHLNQLYRVAHLERPSHLLAHGGDLDRAAGVAGGDQLRAGGEQLLDLAL